MIPFSMLISIKGSNLWVLMILLQSMLLSLKTKVFLNLLMIHYTNLNLTSFFSNWSLIPFNEFKTYLFYILTHKSTKVKNELNFSWKIFYISLLISALVFKTKFLLYVWLQWPIIENFIFWFSLLSLSICNIQKKIIDFKMT